METHAVISDLPVWEGPLLQYMAGLYIPVTQTLTITLTLTLTLNAIRIWSSYARVHNTNSDAIKDFSLIAAIF